LPLFYKDLILFWSDLKKDIEPNNAQDICNEFLWFNPFITIDEQSIFYKKWYQQGIKYVADILDSNGRLLMDNEIKVKFEIEFSFMEYYSLRHSIPKKWKTILSTTGKVYKLNKLPTVAGKCITNVASKDIYWQLHDKVKSSLPSNKWIEHFSLDPGCWPAICRLSFICSYETELQSFQYALLYRFIPYKKKLHIMGLVDSDICDYCDEIDTLVHRFVVCPVVKIFWNNFIIWWRKQNDNINDLTDKNIILGFYDQEDYALNKSILLAKHFIHRKKMPKMSYIISYIL
jgi:hypothetical protein